MVGVMPLRAVLLFYFHCLAAGSGNVNSTVVDVASQVYSPLVHKQLGLLGPPASMPRGRIKARTPSVELLGFAALGVLAVRFRRRHLHVHVRLRPCPLFIQCAARGRGTDRTSGSAHKSSSSSYSSRSSSMPVRATGRGGARDSGGPRDGEDGGGGSRRVPRGVPPGEPADLCIHVILPQRECRWHTFPCDAAGALTRDIIIGVGKSLHRDILDKSVGVFRTCSRLQVTMEMRSSLQRS